MPNLAKTSAPIKPAFRWRTRDGRLMLPSEMRTTHLFYTLRAIWNSLAPACYRVGKSPRLYNFPGWLYPKGYRQEAVYRIGAELKTRSDLPETLKKELEQMREYWKLIQGQEDECGGDLKMLTGC